MGVLGEIGGALKSYGKKRLQQTEDKYGIGKKKKTGDVHADDSDAVSATPGSFKRGGKVRKTGLAKVHKGEKVLTAKQARKRKRSGKVR